MFQIKAVDLNEFTQFIIHIQVGLVEMAILMSKLQRNDILIYIY